MRTARTERGPASSAVKAKGETGQAPPVVAVEGETGQVLPIAVLFLLVIVAVLALTLDGGMAYAQRRRMQNAADAAVLSGALLLANGEYRDAVVRQRVLEYAQRNGADTGDLAYLNAAGEALPNPSDGLVPATTTSLRVTARRTYTTFFARLLGQTAISVSAAATAKAVPGGMPSQMQGLAPLSVPTNFYDACVAKTARCNLWDSSYAQAWGIPANEYKTLVDLSNGAGGGSMPQNVTNWTRDGYPSPVPTNAYIQTNSGNYGANVADALRQRILANPGGIDPDGVLWGTIDISVWDAYRGTDKSVRVQKFGRFKIRLTDIYGSSVTGYFIDFVIPGHQRGPDVPAGPKIIVLGG